MPITIKHQMLSVAEVAEALNICERTVKRRISEGKLVAYKPGLKWRIKQSDLDAYLNRVRHDV